MRRMLSVAAVLAAGLLVPSAADAAIPQVFTKTASPVNCTVQASGQRFCGAAAGAGHRELGQRADRRRGRVPARAGHRP